MLGYWLCVKKRLKGAEQITMENIYILARKVKAIPVTGHGGP
jgi:hypothetical protein